MRSKGAEAVPRNPRERVANGSSMAASNLVAAGGAWVANRWPCCQNADTVSIHSNTSSARAVRHTAVIHQVSYSPPYRKTCCMGRHTNHTSDLLCPAAPV